MTYPTNMKIFIQEIPKSQLDHFHNDIFCLNSCFKHRYIHTFNAFSTLMIHYHNECVFILKYCQVKCRLQTCTLQNWRVLKDLTSCQAHSLSLIMQVTNEVHVRGKFRPSIQKGRTIIWTVEMCWAMKLASLGDGEEKKILKYQKAAVRQKAAGIWDLRQAPCVWLLEWMNTLSCQIGSSPEQNQKGNGRFINFRAQLYFVGWTADKNGVKLMVQAVSQWMWRAGSFRIVSYIVWGRRGRGKLRRRNILKLPGKICQRTPVGALTVFVGFFSTFDTHNSLKLQKRIVRKKIGWDTHLQI